MASNPNGLTLADLEKMVAKCSGFVKMMTGVANNAALLIMVDCLNKIADVRDGDSYRQRPYSPHPRYRHAVKAAFNNALKEKQAYRRALLYPSGDAVRFFHMDDMPEAARKHYTQLTDREYFEFWEGTGALAYQKSLPLVSSLWNKFRLSMQGHGVPHADLAAWGMVGTTVLELSESIYRRSLRSVFEACDGLIPTETLHRIYGPFSLKRVCNAWQHALDMLAPETKNYLLDDVEERNVALGVEQLQDLWTSPSISFDATIQAVEDFSDDIFATKGQAKKAIRSLSAIRDDAVREFEEGTKKKTT